MTSYFYWLVSIIEDGEHKTSDYIRLLLFLFRTEFYAVMSRDENRIEDGLDLRERYIYMERLNIYSDELDAPPYCSVLEMLVALAIRCENEIMYDPDYEDRTSKWFWIMLDNIGLSDFKDGNFDENEANYIISKWLERDYKRSGVGSIFYTNNPKINMQKTEIWYQMNYFIDEFLT